MRPNTLRQWHSHWHGTHAPGSPPLAQSLARCTRTKLPAIGTPLVQPLECAKQLSRARPVRAPTESNCFAHGKALPKTMPVPFTGREKLVRRRTFHRQLEEPPTGKVRDNHYSFSLPRTGPARFWNRLTKYFAIALPLVAHGVRLPNCSAFGQWQSNCFPIGSIAVGGGVGRAARRDWAAASAAHRAGGSVIGTSCKTFLAFAKKRKQSFYNFALSASLRLRVRNNHYCAPA